MKADLIYIYSGGRSEKINNNNLSPSDFFYGYLEFSKSELKTEFIELKDKKTNILDRIIIKISKVPIYSFKALTFQNFIKLKNSKNLIYINESSYFSFLPFTFFIKNIYNKKIIFFPMGLIDRFEKGNWFTKKIVSFGISVADKIFFIGKGELDKASRVFKKHKKKFSYLPFSVDTKFWQNNKTSSTEIINLLFVGNDQNRKFDLVAEMCSKLPDYKFTIVSEHNFEKIEGLKNVEILKGNWRKSNISDSEMHKIYSKADLVILPIREAYQPSGQSVAIQAMSVGTPVLISKTHGFWDFDLFKNNENIFFTNNSIQNWTNQIKFISKDIDLLEKVSINAHKTIREHHEMNNFIELLKIQLNISGTTKKISKN